jgi:hypothetical protein
MPIARLILAVLILICLLLMAGVCAAQEYWPASVRLSALPGADKAERGVYVALGLRKYINSFTSYQFPNDPNQGPQDPLSRLEHPWEQIYGVVRLGADMRTLAFEMEFASTLSKFSNLNGQDSDWEDKNNPGQKTTFSQYDDRPSGWTFDISTTIPVPDAPILAGVLGFRAQHFKFDGYDMVQGSIWDSGSYRPQTKYDVYGGALGTFSQDFKHYYAGGVIRGLAPLGALSDSLASVSLLVKLQGDGAFVNGNNADFHFLKADQGTFEETSGWSWHLNLTAGLLVGDRLRVDLEGDFIRIRTSGTHKEHKSTWDGARVWSDQGFVSITGTCAF